MWISSTRPDFRLVAMALAVLTLSGGCASTPDQDEVDLDEEREEVESRYAEVREGAAAEAADSPHVPPVPHDEEVVPQAREAIDEYVRAMQAMREGRLDDAMIMLQSIHARYPDLSGPLVNQGIIYLRRDEFADAADVLRQALEVNDRNPYAYNALGVALREKGRFDKAEEYYTRALELDPQYARAHFNMGVLAELYKQDLVSAVEHFRAYQRLQRQPDRTVENWITDLERRAPEAVEAAQTPEEMDVEAPSAPQNGREEAGESDTGEEDDVEEPEMDAPDEAPETTEEVEEETA